jgi:hypothetical protein
VNYFTPVPKNDQRERATTLSATALQRCFDRLSARLDHRRGPAPFISTWLFATCHSTFPIGIYVVICAIISIIATALLPDYTNKDISPRRIMKSRCSNGERPDWRSLRGSLGLRPHTAGGGCSVSMVYRDCGCRPQCGKCVPLVRQMLRESTEVPTGGG